MKTKKCTKCKEIRTIDNFVKDKYRPDGFAGNCKICRKKNKEKIKNSNKVIPKEKICRSCKETKLSSYFDKASMSYDGLACNCKECRSIKNKESLKNKRYIKVSNKKCNSCNITKEISFFHKYSYSKDDYSSICKSCVSIQGKNFYKKEKEAVKEKMRMYRENNRELIRARERQKRIDNGDEIRRKDREYRAKNRQKHRDLNKRWRDNNKEKLKILKKEYATNNRDVINKWVSDYKKENPLFKLGVQTRSLIATKFSILSKGLKVKSKKSEEILGCTMEEFKNHIEKQFTNWMSWDNYGNCETNDYDCSWHLDHIVPVSYAKNEKEFYMLNHWSNFQPKCGKKNLEKNGTFCLCTNLELNMCSSRFKRNSKNDK